MTRSFSDPRLVPEELIQLIRQIGYLREWSSAPRGTRINFELGLPDVYDPLLPSLICRLLFGGQSEHGINAGIDLSTALSAKSPRICLTPDRDELKLLGFTGWGRYSPVKSEPEGLCIGQGASGSEVSIGNRDLKRHLYMIGATGVGKPTLIASPIRQDIETGRSVVLIDPHGDLYNEVLECLPRKARKRAILADVSNFSDPFTLNLFEIEDGPDAAIQRNFVCNQLIDIFKKVLYRGAPEAFGPIFEAYFRNAAMLLMDAEGTNASLCDFDRLFGDSKYRRSLLERCDDEMVVRFWRAIAVKAGGDAALENIAPYIVSKLTQFTGNPLIRPIIGATRSSLKFDRVLTPGGICLINLAKGSVGDYDAALIGAIVTTRLFASILGRTSMPASQRHPVRLYMDEFQTYAIDALGQMLAESRKFGLEMVLANQPFSQIGTNDGRNIAEAILANVANILAFRVGPPDAHVLAEWFAPETDPLQLMRMPDRQFAARLLVGGQPAPTCVLRTMNMTHYIK